VNMET